MTTDSLLPKGKLTERALEWLTIWGAAALYWCEGEVYSELKDANMVDGEHITPAGRLALHGHGRGE